MPLKKIGLALSGGGFRAAVYHMGVLARLADENLLEEVEAISSVSGGSWGTGLVFAVNNFVWPTSSQYFETVVPKARKHLTTQNLQANLINGVIEGILTLDWKIIYSRATLLSHLLKRRWGITKNLRDLPDSPQWIINSTSYESSEAWFFSKNAVGDRRFGYTRDTDKIHLSEALAASGAFPGLIGALSFPTKKLHWEDQSPEFPDRLPKVFQSSGEHFDRADIPTLHLWDGGVYDNNGVGVFYNFESDSWDRGVEFLIVSDASGGLDNVKYQMFTNALLQIIFIMMQQVRQSRLEAIMEQFRERNPKARGMYVPIDHTCEQTIAGAKFSQKTIDQIKKDSLPLAQVLTTKAIQTEARQLTSDEFYTLFRHGFEVMDYSLFAHDHEQFKHTAFADSRWQGIVA